MRWVGSFRRRPRVTLIRYEWPTPVGVQPVVQVIIRW